MPAKKKKSVIPASGMTPNKHLITAARQRAHAALPEALQGIPSITHLGDQGSGEPGMATPVKGLIKALVMPLDLATLCVDAEGCAHDIICHLADARASVVKTGALSAYAVGRLDELMRRLNMGTERLKLEVRKAIKAAKT